MLLAKKDTQKSNSRAVVAQSAPSPSSGNVISSIKEALTGAQSLQCDFTDEEGRKIVSYVKNGAVRTDIAATDPKQSGSMIMKDNKMYFWNGKQGTMMAFDIAAILDSISVTPQPAQGNIGQKPEDIVESLEKYKESCKAATVDDALFTPPADVKFIDLSSMKKTVAPSGAMPSAMTEEQIKALQQKYQQ